MPVQTVVDVISFARHRNWIQPPPQMPIAWLRRRRKPQILESSVVFAIPKRLALNGRMQPAPVAAAQPVENACFIQS
jgi:hypothetical protein